MSEAQLALRHPQRPSAGRTGLRGRVWLRGLVRLAGQAVVEGAQGGRRVARWPWWHPAVLAAVGGGLVLSWVLRLAGLV